MIIGICGLAGSGKDTLADMLCEKYGFVKLSFGSVLKDIVSIIFSWDREKLEGSTMESREWRETPDEWWSKKLEIPDLTPRKVLQQIGTNVFRKHFHKDIWVSVLERKLEMYPKVVVTDCRFSNEIEMIRKCGGKIVRLQRGELPSWYDKYFFGEIEEPKNVHPSEYMWIREKFDYEIKNNGDKKEMLKELYPLVSGITLRKK